MKWVNPPETESLTLLDKIKLLPNELEAAERSSPDELSEQEWYEVGKHRLDLTSRSNNISARKTFAWAIYAMVSTWLAAVLTVTVLTGLKVLVLDKAVLIALIVSASANVISLFSLVAKYLFHVHEAHEPIIEPLIKFIHEARSKPGTETPENDD